MRDRLLDPRGHPTAFLWRSGHVATAASLLVAAALTASCGGGSGSDTATASSPPGTTTGTPPGTGSGTGSGPTSGEPPATPPTGVRLDANNMQQAARNANDSFVLFDLAMFAGQYMAWGSERFQSGMHYACQAGDAASGTVMLSTIRTDGPYRAGDVLTVSYNNCQLEANDSARMTGTLVLTVQAATGNPSAAEEGQPWSYRARVVYQGLTVLSPHDRTVVDGDMVVSESSPGPVNEALDEQVTTSFETAAIRLTEDADTHLYTRASGVLVSNYTAEKTWTATIGADLSSSTLSGKLSFATTEPFVGRLGSSFPYQGQGRITTDNQQTMNLRAQPSGVKGELALGQDTTAFFIEWANY